jgi:lipopolysaccharide transport system ATP-binding protein
MNAIEVRNLGKKFRIGGKQMQDSTFAEAIWHTFTAPLKRTRSLMKNQLPSFADVDFWALREITFDVAEGEVMGIIGANGAGKSTLLKLLTRISAPSEGYARIRGRVSSLLEVGTGFHQELTGRENVFMNGTILGMKQHEIRAKFDEIVDFSGVEAFIDTPVKRYSSGMQMRLAFSVAAHLEPEVLLVDEVLSVGDADFRRKSLGKMREATKSGRTVLTASHNMASIQNLCDRAILLQRGRIVMVDVADKVVAEYLQRSYGGEGNAVVDLTFRPARKASAPPPVFKTLRVLDGNGQPSPVIQVGRPLVLELTLDTGDRHFDHVNLIISVNNEFEQRVLRFDFQQQTGRLLTVEGQQSYVCRWDECIIGPGNYGVDVTMVTKSAAMNQRGAVSIDRVVDAIRFEIAEGDIFGQGGKLNQNHAMVWPRVNWAIDGQSVGQTLMTNQEEL